VVHKEKWRNEKSNAYYLRLENPLTHRYSEQAVDFLVQKLSEDPAYLERAVESYSHAQRRKRKNRKT
jgi:hypothetical protein